MLTLDLLLKRNELCLVGPAAAVHDKMHEAGLYARDTRFLSRFALKFRGSPNAAAGSSAALARPGGDHSHESPPQGTSSSASTRRTILVREQVELDGEMVVTLTVRNFGAEPVSGTVSLESRRRLPRHVRHPRHRARHRAEPRVRNRPPMASCSRQWRSTSGRSRRGSRAPSRRGPATPDQRGARAGPPALASRPAARGHRDDRGAGRPGAGRRAAVGDRTSSRSAATSFRTSPHDAVARLRSLHRQCDSTSPCCRPASRTATSRRPVSTWFIAPFGRDSLNRGAADAACLPGPHRVDSCECSPRCRRPTSTPGAKRNPQDSPRDALRRHGRVPGRFHTLPTTARSIRRRCS